MVNIVHMVGEMKDELKCRNKDCLGCGENGCRISSGRMVVLSDQILRCVTLEIWPVTLRLLIWILVVSLR